MKAERAGLLRSSLFNLLAELIGSDIIIFGESIKTTPASLQYLKKEVKGDGQGFDEGNPRKVSGTSLA